MGWWRKGPWIGVFVGALVVVVGAHAVDASTGTFVDVPGIPGEATFTRAAGQIEAISFSWNVGQVKTTRYGTVGVCSASAAKPVFSGLCVTKHLDKASPKLLVAAALGTSFQTVTISTYRTSGAPALLARYTLSSALVSSVKTETAPGDELPRETVCFNFNKAALAVTVQNSDGRPVTTVEAGFDACANAAF